jgi:hypothetical protein
MGIDQPAGIELFGYIRSVQIDLNTRVLTAQIICNKDLNVELHTARFLESVRTEVAHRLGLSDRVLIDDIENLFQADSPFFDRILREMWHYVVGRGYRVAPALRLAMRFLNSGSS